MKLSQCLTFTAVTATLLSTQTAARIGRPTADDQYETVLVDDAKGSHNANRYESDQYVSWPGPLSDYPGDTICPGIHIEERCEDTKDCHWNEIGYCMSRQSLDDYDNLIETKADADDRSYTENKEDNEDFFIGVGNPGKEGDRCRFPFPNCGSGLTCRNRRSGNPICHRNDTCRPRGMACVRDSDCCGNLRCPDHHVVGNVVFHSCE